MINKNKKLNVQKINISNVNGGDVKWRMSER